LYTVFEYQETNVIIYYKRWQFKGEYLFSLTANVLGNIFLYYLNSNYKTLFLSNILILTFFIVMIDYKFSLLWMEANIFILILWIFFMRT